MENPSLAHAVMIGTPAGIILGACVLAAILLVELRRRLRRIAARRTRIFGRHQG